MARPVQTSWLSDAVRGAIAGAVGTWLMDLATTGLVEGQSGDSKRREEAARPNDKSSLANLLDRIEAATGASLDDARRTTAIQVMHYGLGALPGAAYGVVRRRLPLFGAGRGLVYGLALFAVNDEYLNMKLGLAGPFGAYPADTHWRGLVGHAVLGAATDTGIDLLGG
jgi:hypothetical protein